MIITRDQINGWNRIAEAVKGTQSYYCFTMWHEFKDVSGRFQPLSHSTIRAHMIEIEGEEFYIKKVKGELWLYWEYRGDCERWCLSDIARAYFDIKEEA
jgi:hypothetical protein